MFTKALLCDKKHSVVTWLCSNGIVIQEKALWLIENCLNEYLSTKKATALHAIEIKQLSQCV